MERNLHRIPPMTAKSREIPGHRLKDLLNKRGIRAGELPGKHGPRSIGVVLNMKLKR